ncbi:MAG: hypothetical protein JW786_04370 [Desulfobacterales bacterium]|nr:hypothetical protein [Desulfobacterales bacterium]
MELKKNFKVIFIACLLFLSTAFLHACRNHFYNYNGATAKQENRLALLAEGAHDQFLQTTDLSIKYTYSQKSNRIELSGVVDFTAHLKHFETIEYFSLRMHFLDVEGKILQSSRILTADNHQKINKMAFKQNLLIPSNAHALAFSYSGRVMGGGESPSAWDFWMVP